VRSRGLVETMGPATEQIGFVFVSAMLWRFIVGKGGYNGGSTVLRPGSNWLGRSAKHPQEWGPESLSQLYKRALNDRGVPDIEDREIQLEKMRQRREEKRRKRAVKRAAQMKEGSDENSQE